MIILSNNKETSGRKIIQPGGAPEPILPFPVLPREEENGICQPVVTIDDLETLAEKLLTEIRTIKSYKYPLAVRRGVRPH